MSKVLITGGCSFSICFENDVSTWPIHLYKILQQHGYTEHISKAMGSQGNGLISRGIIYAVSKALESYNPEDILVGVMWSGSNRLDYRCANTDLLSFGKMNTDGWIENPTGFVDEADKKWVIMNPNWNILEAQTYYKFFHDYVGSTIYSLEHILRTQYYLKSKNVKYFFTDFVDNNIIDSTSQEVVNSKIEYEHLVKELDRDNYLPVSSEHRWLYENSITKEEYHKRHLYNGRMSQWVHPNHDEHKEFVDQIIVPYLKSRKWLL